VAVLDTADGKTFTYRGDERFAMCSTFKALVAGFVLKRVDQGQERLDRRIRYGKSVLITHSPATEKHVGDGMTVGALCEATITLSDNAAANLLLDTFGGPQALTTFLRGLGDKVTRCDGYEPGLNVVKPGEIHDTTSPNAMLATLRTLTLGRGPVAGLAPATDRLADRQPDRRQAPAGRPAGRLEGRRQDRQLGRRQDGTTNDIAVIWPSVPGGFGRPPLLITTYLSRSSLDNDGRNAVIAEVARLVVAAGFGS
jgi:beta-lactamase class A